MAHQHTVGGDRNGAALAMGDNSAIEWTDATWNPVTGCSKVSPGCAHCYAETLALGRLAGTDGYPGLPWTPANAAANVRVREDRLDQPLRWRRPRMVFVNSMSDLFHEHVPDEFVAQVFAVMSLAPQHIFQVLTKRPERARALLSCETRRFVELVRNRRYDYNRYAPNLTREGWPLPNVWMGTSIENRRYVSRADELRETPAAVRFISAEPLLGPLIKGDHTWPEPELDLANIDWLIVGGECGPRHRPMDLQWVRDLRDACLWQDWGCDCGELNRLHQARPGHRTAFFFKQLGGARSGTALGDLPRDLRIRELPAREAA